jgi:thiamine biosynthesis protein ThiS
MNITINGESREVSSQTRISDLLLQLNVPRERVAIELNLSIIDREQFAQVILKEGDTLEIINFVGGGEAH